MAIDYRLLGPLAVVRDGVPVELGAYRQRALLGLLLANAGTVLSTDRILDELWGETIGHRQAGLAVGVRVGPARCAGARSGEALGGDDPADPRAGVRAGRRP